MSAAAVASQLTIQGRESANGDALDPMQLSSLLLLNVSAIKGLFETKRTDHNDIHT